MSRQLLQAKAAQYDCEAHLKNYMTGREGGVRDADLLDARCW